MISFVCRGTMRTTDILIRLVTGVGVLWGGWFSQSGHGRSFHMWDTRVDCTIVVMAALALRCSHFLCASDSLLSSEIREPLMMMMRLCQGDDPVPGFPMRQCRCLRAILLLLMTTEFWKHYVGPDMTFAVDWALKTIIYLCWHNPHLFWRFSIHSACQDIYRFWYIYILLFHVT